MTIGTFETMLLVMFVAVGFIVVVFLPSMIETKRPKDKGPRKVLRSLHRKTEVRRPSQIVVPRPDSRSAGQNLKDLQQVLCEAGVSCRRIGVNIVRILEGVEFAPNSEIMETIVVEGSMKAETRCVFHGSVKAKGNAVIGDGVVIEGNLIALGDVDLGDNVVVGGSVHSEGRAKLGRKTHIGVAVVAAGDVEIHEDSEISKQILAGTTVKVLRHPKVELPPNLDEIE